MFHTHDVAHSARLSDTVFLLRTLMRLLARSTAHVVIFGSRRIPCPFCNAFNWLNSSCGAASDSAPMKTKLVLLFTAILTLGSLTSCDPYYGGGYGSGYGSGYGYGSSYYRPSYSSYGYNRYSSGYRPPSYGYSRGYSGHHSSFGGFGGGYSGHHSTFGGFGGGYSGHHGGYSGHHGSFGGGGFSGHHGGHHH